MIKSVTLENGKTYRVIQRRHSVLIEVLTCRVHHEVNVPIYMEVTGRHVVAKVMAKLVEESHAEALEMNAELDEAIRINEKSAQDQAITQTLARRNSLSHKIGLAFAGAALVFSSLAAPVQAEVAPSYPVDASRMSLEGSVAVSIDCSTRTVDVIRESNNAGYFSKQVKKQVSNICHGEKGTLDRVYVFKMNKRVGAHDMMVNNTGRWTL